MTHCSIAAGIAITVAVVIIILILYRREWFTPASSLSGLVVNGSATLAPSANFNFREKSQALVADDNMNLSLSNIVPVGGIIMWAGSISDAQSLTGWALCDGTNGTPDLRSRFIVGAASDSNDGNALANSSYDLTSYAPNNIGGEESHTLLSQEMPPHQHVIYTGDYCTGGSCTTFGATTYINNDVPGSSTGWAGGSDDSTTAAHNNMPPFYALAFIMKTQ